ncbi:MAG: hypothetical protein HC904_10920 [Blastochloris sp.]|nr:hypothetical protein [Blastochloris sp.]
MSNEVRDLISFLGRSPGVKHDKGDLNELRKKAQSQSGVQGRVALKAIKAVKTVAQIAADNHVHRLQVTQWKTQMLEWALAGPQRGP